MDWGLPRLSRFPSTQPTRNPGSVFLNRNRRVFYSCKLLPDKIFFLRDVTFCLKIASLYIVITQRVCKVTYIGVFAWVFLRISSGFPRPIGSGTRARGSRPTMPGLPEVKGTLTKYLHIRCQL